ncbi:YbaK/EbsC family protein [Isachenkonia alkalipeptolytica]|uniref:YbaK/EbsC family protein n=1 Tax=Isachenkonia alkalipeptolytica TaxID=2565777 RepID=A0AA43XK55_9CLOT|nr:YbaK/EbsC family protein [Isachenkonia alkalipeptolytica]NBG87771.1 YbaK/EbsC family protein [Isachenkonia alkalipeptolytica]
MSFEDVKKYFVDKGLGSRVEVLNTSSATVEMAADALGCEAKQIAKTLSFIVDKSPILVVAAGNVKMDNKKFKSHFGRRPKMIPGKSVKELIGHDVGGVCPFVVKSGVKIYLDVSLKQNDLVYPAAGSENSLVKLSIEELEEHTGFEGWVDVGK